MNQTTYCPGCERLVPILEAVTTTERVFGREVRAEVGCMHQRLTFIGSFEDWAPQKEKAS
jgi:hypothetical protein